MSLVILFVLLVLLNFGVLFYFLKPSPMEAAIQRQLTGIRENPATSAEGTILKDEGLSATPWLHDLLRQVPGSPELLDLIRQAGRKWQVSSLVLGSLAMTFSAFVITRFILPSLLLSACVAACAGLLPFLYLYILREVRFKRCDALLPDAVDLMARALRAGHAVTSALEMVGREIAEPLASEFRTIHEEQSLGLPLREAVLNFVRRVPRDDALFLATAILVQRETGGNLVQILEKAAVVMRERVRLRGQLKIYTAQGRITGWVLCAMPFLMFGLISLVNRDYESILFSDPLGMRLIYIGLGMMIAGILIIRKIIDVRV